MTCFFLHSSGLHCRSHYKFASNWKDRTMSRHVSFTERRRASLRRQVDRLELLELRNTITEPISVLGLSLSAYSGLNRLGIADLRAMSNGLTGSPRQHRRSLEAASRPAKPGAPDQFRSGRDRPWTGRHAAAGGGAGSEQDGPAQASQARVESGDAAATGTPAAASDGDQTGISSPWHPVSQSGGGAALPPRGGSGGLTPTKAASRAAGPSASLPASTPAASGAGGSAAMSGRRGGRRRRRRVSRGRVNAASCAARLAEARRGWRWRNSRRHSAPDRRLRRGGAGAPPAPPSGRARSRPDPRQRLGSESRDVYIVSSLCVGRE